MSHASCLSARLLLVVALCLMLPCLCPARYVRTLWAATLGPTLASPTAVPVGTSTWIMVGTSSGKMYAVDSSTSALKWAYSVPLASPIVPSPIYIVSGGVTTIFFGADNGIFYALAGLTGAVSWQYQTGNSVRSVAVESDGVIYVGSYDYKLYALLPSNGAVLWTYTTAAEIVVKPFVVGDAVYVIGGRVLYYLNKYDGTVVHTPYNSDNGVNVTGMFSPAVNEAGPNIFFGTAAGLIQSVILYPVNVPYPLWDIDTLINTPITSSAVYYSGYVYIGSTDFSLLCIEEVYGNIKWKYTTGGAIASTPVVVNDIVYIGSDDMKVYALHAFSGR